MNRMQNMQRQCLVALRQHLHRVAIMGAKNVSTTTDKRYHTRSMLWSMMP
jgi:hypothetical protein